MKKKEERLSLRAAGETCSCSKQAASSSINHRQKGANETEGKSKHVNYSYALFSGVRMAFESWVRE